MPNRWVIAAAGVVSSYGITAPLGAGGMGEVYRGPATDPQCDQFEYERTP